MSATAYVLVQRGVGIASIGGVWLGIAPAIEAAREIAAKDVDDWHRYVVWAVPLGACEAFGREYGYPHFLNGEPIYAVAGHTLKELDPPR